MTSTSTDHLPSSVSVFWCCLYLPPSVLPAVSVFFPNLFSRCPLVVLFYGLMVSTVMLVSQCSDCSHHVFSLWVAAGAVFFLAGLTCFAARCFHSSLLAILSGQCVLIVFFTKNLLMKASSLCIVFCVTVHVSGVYSNIAFTLDLNVFTFVAVPIIFEFQSLSVP